MTESYSMSKNVSSPSITKKITVAVIISSLLLSLSMLVSISFIDKIGSMANNNFEKSSQNYEDVIKLSMLSKELQIDVIQVQQWVTDISATRGLNGLNDGLDQAAEFASKFDSDMSSLKLHAEKINQPKLLEILKTIEGDCPPYYSTGRKMAEAYIANGPSGLEGGNNMMSAFDAGAEKINNDIDELIQLAGNFSNEIHVLNDKFVSNFNTEKNFINYVTYIAIFVGILLFGAAGLYIYRSIGNPIKQITGVMNKLAVNDMTIFIPYLDRSDEIGDMANAVEVFKDNALRNEQLMIEQEAEKKLSAERELAAQEEAGAIIRKTVINSLEVAIEKMAKGELEYKITDDFPEEFESVKDDFNSAFVHLAKSLGEIRKASTQIRNGSVEMATASGDLAKRTERQAATVEETAAALEQTTTVMRSSTQRAEEAGILVSTAKNNAENSSDIVQKAVAAMNKIEKSAEDISNIIGVIDDIAFQTNLLALNAGVEAARAGESGKGFAVVAQEVRELAQRSASAAKEIKILITTSGDDVKTGALLVNETGKALDSIVTEVAEVNEHIVAIVSAANEQSVGLEEINQSISTIDRVTQQNAAVAEQSVAASLSLTEEVAKIDDKLMFFKTRSDARISGGNFEKMRAKNSSTTATVDINKTAAA